MAKKIFFGNYKGGVGKTTSTFQIAAWFAKKNKKVLLIDMDPQSSLSKLCYKHIGKPTIPHNHTLNYYIEVCNRFIINYLNDYDLITGNYQIINGINQPNVTGVKTLNLHLQVYSYPNNSNLQFIYSAFEYKNSRLNDIADKMSRNIHTVCSIPMILKSIEKQIPNLDYIIIDCPPTSNILTQSTFMSSDFYIIPTIYDSLSSDGVPDYIAEIESVYTKFQLHEMFGGIFVKEMFGDRPQLVGVFESVYKNRGGKSFAHSDAIMTLDNKISELKTKVLLADDIYKQYRYNFNQRVYYTNYSIMPDITTTNVFSQRIRHLDNRSSSNGIPAYTEQGLPHSEYEVLADNINTISSLEDYS